MAGNYSKKTQSENAHLANLTSARYVYIDGGQTAVTARSTAGRLLRIVIFTKGLAFIVDNGSEPVANVATTTPEGTYDCGIYCDANIKVNGISGSGSALLVFSD